MQGPGRAPLLFQPHGTLSVLVGSLGGELGCRMLPVFPAIEEIEQIDEGGDLGVKTLWDAFDACCCHPRGLLWM
jgi:hypothetical protein